MCAKWTMTVAASLLISACSTMPPSLQGDVVNVTQKQAASPEFAGQSVRWAGVVVGSRDTGRGSCVEVRARPVEPITARPGPRTNVEPRFLACDSKTLSADMMQRDTPVTFVGTIDLPQTFEVDASTCDRFEGTAPKRYLDGLRGAYKDNIHAAAAGKCVVTLPTIEVAAAHVWPEQPVHPFPQTAPQSAW
jgi:hypothetical protein